LAAFKSWFQPRVAVAAAIERSFVTGKMRTGLTVQVRSSFFWYGTLGLVLELEFRRHEVQSVRNLSYVCRTVKMLVVVGFYKAGSSPASLLMLQLKGAG
jgi:hypothetical protein